MNTPATEPLPFRGIYFASHFDNVYQTWPLDELDSLLQDYAGVGANAFMNWLDLNEVTRADLDAPGTAAHTYRMRVAHLLQSARRLGMTTTAANIANACFIDQFDPALAADTSGWSGRSAYKHQLCLSNRKARAICLQNAVDTAAWFRGVDALSIWTYDQGGCDCKRCAPYSVACVRFAREVQDAAGVPVCLSAWHMPDDQAAAMLAEIARLFDRPPVLFFNHDSRPHHHGPNAGRLRRMAHFDAVRAVGFPEIAMIQDDTQVGTFAWNLFGANPMPRYFTDRLRQQRAWMHGIHNYSEGAYDHLNMVAMLCAAANGTLSADRIVSDYARRYLNDAVADAFVGVVRRLEDNWLHFDDSAVTGPTLRAVLDIDAKLPAARRGDFRWRLIRLRAQLDDLAAQGRQRGLAAVDGALDAAFAELREVYRATPRTWPRVSAERLPRSPGRWLPAR